MASAGTFPWLLLIAIWILVVVTFFGYAGLGIGGNQVLAGGGNDDSKGPGSSGASVIESFTT